MRHRDREPSRRRRLYRLGLVLHRLRWAVLSLTLVGLAVAVPLGAAARDALVLSRFQSPGSESIAARALLADQFDTGSWDALFLVTAEQGSVDDRRVAAAGRELTEQLARHDGVAEVTSYWSRRSSSTLRGQDGRHAVVLMRLPGDPTWVRQNLLPELEETFERSDDLITVQLGGGDQVFRQVGEQAEADFTRAEAIIIPLAFVLLVLLLRSVVAALLPLATALLTVVFALGSLSAVTAFTEVSTFALNLILVMGLALGIDYCLFVLARFREELHRGRSVAHAVARSVETAGRAMLFSGVTVAVSLSVLLLFPFPFLRSFAYAGMAVAVCGMAMAVVVLPAALAVLGPRVNNWTIWRRTGAPPPFAATSTHGFWHAASLRVMRRPIAFGTAATVTLLVLGVPFLGLELGTADHRVLTPDASSHQVQETIRAQFPAEEDDAINVVAPRTAGPAPGGSVDHAVAAYAAELSRVGGITEVQSVAGTFAAGQRVHPPGTDHGRYAADGGTWFMVVPDMDDLTADRHGMIDAIRNAPAAFDVLVGGYPAELVDFQRALQARIPGALGLIFAITFVVLFLMTGSVVMPVKATVLNMLSLSAMLGALVWIFQEGNLSDLLGFTPMDSLEVSIPILMFCVAYGLSMDYEVFMISRIKEEYDRTGDDRRAVAAGLQRSGPLITAAAAILALSFSVYATADVTLLQMLGVGVALAIVVDASLVRAILVPSFMRLAGPLNWWAPAPLRRLHDRFGLSDADPDPDPVDSDHAASTAAAATGRS